ncbi:NHL repeat-containing protein [Thalassotalea aquiviva]|uniref:NHL repeat-containing protein n=1 Tax=Thalassotalea aquiviva TaxID=3242415 RepID=UPI00352B33A3
MKDLNFNKVNLSNSLPPLFKWMLRISFALLISGCDGAKEMQLTPITVIESSDPALVNIDSIAISDNKIYVSDFHDIKVFNNQGNLLQVIGSAGDNDGQFRGEVIGLAINSRNELLAVDMDAARIQVFNLDGKFIRSFGVKGDKNGQFLQPQGLTVDQYDLIYVSDKQRSDIQVFSPLGEYLYTIGQKGSGQQDLSEPESMAIRNNKIYIADENNHRIQVYDLRGHYIETLPQNKILLTKTQEASIDDIIFTTGINKRFNRRPAGDIEGLAFDNDNTLYFIIEDLGKIARLKDGSIISSFTSSLQLISPDGIAFSSDHKILYVVDQGNNRILAFDVSSID